MNLEVPVSARAKAAVFFNSIERDEPDIEPTLEELDALEELLRTYRNIRAKVTPVNDAGEEYF